MPRHGRDALSQGSGPRSTFCPQCDSAGPLPVLLTVRAVCGAAHVLVFSGHLSRCRQWRSCIFIVNSTSVCMMLVLLSTSTNIMFECRRKRLKVSLLVLPKPCTLHAMLCCSMLCCASCARRTHSSAFQAVHFEKVDRNRARWLTWLVCFPAPSELAGCFLVADKEGPARERRRQSASARPCVDTVVLAVSRSVREAILQPLG